MRVVLGRPMVIGVQEGPGVIPLIPAPTTGLLFARVGDRPTLAAEVEVDLRVGKVDPLTGQRLPDLGGSPRSSVPLGGDELFLGLGERGPLGTTVRVEAGHDPGLAPALKQFPQPSARDTPPSRHLGESISVPAVLGLTDEVGDPKIGELRHASESVSGKLFETPNGLAGDSGCSAQRPEGR